METNNGIEAIHAKTRTQWRKWLAKHCESKKSVCLILGHKNSKTKSVAYAEAIEEALVFWLDRFQSK